MKNQKSNPEIELTVYKALELAISYIYENNLIYEEDYKLVITREKEKWIFWFQYLPMVPGKDLTIFVEKDKTIERLEGY